MYILVILFFVEFIEAVPPHNDVIPRLTCVELCFGWSRTRY